MSLWCVWRRKGAVILCMTSNVRSKYTCLRQMVGFVLPVIKCGKSRQNIYEETPLQCKDIVDRLVSHRQGYTCIAEATVEVCMIYLPDVVDTVTKLDSE